MPQIELVDPTRATGPTRAILDDVARHAGRVPNGVRVLAASPTVLEAWWQFERALARSSVRLGVREQLAVLTAATSGCTYCLDLHRAAALAVGVEPSDIDAAHDGRAGDPRADATLRFARAALVTPGPVPVDVVAGARAAGLGDAELIEVLAVVALEHPPQPRQPDRRHPGRSADRSTR